MKKVLLFAALLVFAAANTYAQETWTQSSIDLKASFWGQQGDASTGISIIRVGPADNSTDPEVVAGSNIIGGKIEYTYHTNPYWGFGVSAGFLTGDASVEVSGGEVDTEANGIVPILFTTRYYPLGFTNLIPLKPYLKGALGLYMGMQSSETVAESINIETRTETSVGGFLGVGADFVLGSVFKLNAEGGYNIVGEFSEPIGGRKDYNGPEFSIGLGFMF